MQLFDSDTDMSTIPEESPKSQKETFLNSSRIQNICSDITDINNEECVKDKKIELAICEENVEKADSDAQGTKISQEPNLNEKQNHYFEEYRILNKESEENYEIGHTESQNIQIADKNKGTNGNSIKEHEPVKEKIEIEVNNVEFNNKNQINIKPEQENKQNCELYKTELINRVFNNKIENIVKNDRENEIVGENANVNNDLIKNKMELNSENVEKFVRPRDTVTKEMTGTTKKENEGYHEMDISIKERGENNRITAAEEIKEQHEVTNELQDKSVINMEVDVTEEEPDKVNSSIREAEMTHEIKYKGKKQYDNDIKMDVKVDTIEGVNEVQVKSKEVKIKQEIICAMAVSFDEQDAANNSITDDSFKEELSPIRHPIGIVIDNQVKVTNKTENVKKKENEQFSTVAEIDKDSISNTYVKIEGENEKKSDNDVTFEQRVGRKIENDIQESEENHEINVTVEGQDVVITGDKNDELHIENSDVLQEVQDYLEGPDDLNEIENKTDDQCNDNNELKDQLDKINKENSKVQDTLEEQQNLIKYNYDKKNIIKDSVLEGHNNSKIGESESTQMRAIKDIIPHIDKENMDDLEIAENRLENTANIASQQRTAKKSYQLNDSCQEVGKHNDKSVKMPNNINNTILKNDVQMDNDDIIDIADEKDENEENENSININTTTEKEKTILINDVQEMKSIPYDKAEGVLSNNSLHETFVQVANFEQTNLKKSDVDEKILLTLSNTLDVLSDEEDESEKEISGPQDKECTSINVDDDDDIMLIDEESSPKDDKSKAESVSEPANETLFKEDGAVESINKKERHSEISESKKDKIQVTEDIASNTDLKSSEPKSDLTAQEETPAPKKPLVQLNFLQTYKKNFADMSRDELEEFCILKIVEGVVDRSNLSEIKTQFLAITHNLEEYMKKASALTKQNRDLQVVLKSVQEEQKKKSNMPITPLKITRSVGMQVLMTDKVGVRKKLQNPKPPTPSANSGPNRQGKAAQNQTKLQKILTNSNNSSPSIPVPRLVPAINNSNLKIQTVPANTPVKPQVTGPLNNTAIPSVTNGLPVTPSAQKPEKRPHSRMQQNNSVTVDLTDDEPPPKVISRNATAPVRLVPPQNLLAPHRQPFGQNVSSPRKVYIPISGSQAAVGVRPGQTIMLKTISPQGPRQRGPTPGVVKQNQGPNAVRMQRVQSRHPAPLPESVKQYHAPNWKTLAPAPELKLSKVENGIVISWKIDGYVEETYEEIACYQIYAYQETTSPPSTGLWKKIGDVKALPLPMACTLTQFLAGYRYYFAVRAVDIRSRLGPFSVPGSILLLNK